MQKILLKDLQHQLDRHKPVADYEGVINCSCGWQARGQGRTLPFNKHLEVMIYNNWLPSGLSNT